MYTITYAIRALRRNRGRYLLFGILLIALFAIACVNLTLGQTAAAACEAVKDEIGTKFYLKQTTYTTYTMQRTDYAYFNFVDLIDRVEFRSLTRRQPTGYLFADGTIDPNYGYGWWVGLNDAEPHAFNRTDNPAVLLEGRYCTEPGECVITDLHAAYLREKGLIDGVGDTLTCYTHNSALSKPPEERETYTLTVVGIVDAETVDARYREDPENPYKHVIFRPMADLEALSSLINLEYDSLATGRADQLSTGYEVIYHLHRYEDAMPFVERVEETLHQMSNSFTIGFRYETPEELARRNTVERNLIVESVVPDFEQMIPPLEQMQSFTAITSVTLAVLAVAVVVLMCVINMRERKYELGVLRCVGMSRGKITLTLGVECLLFLAVAAILGIAAGAGIFALSGEMLIDLTVVETAIDTVAIGVDVAKWVSLAALALAVIATTVSAGFVLRARPLAILRNRT